jgi:hypothetical protein
MRRSPDRPWLSAGLLALASALLSGCAENESMLFIDGVLAMEAPECEVTADSGSTLLLSGVVDAALTETYRGVLLVGNQLVRRGARDQLRTETATVSIDGTEVHVLDSDQRELDSYTVPSSGTISPGTGTEAGYGGVGTDLLQPVDRFLSQGLVVVDVQVYGETLGGQAVESNWFTFPIRVTYGELIDYPADAMDPNTGLCSGPAPEEAVDPCYPGQDGPTACTSCRDRVQLCYEPFQP